MFCLWISFSLIYTLQNGVSADQGVSLTCNQTGIVTFGESVTLKCLINSGQVEDECTVIDYAWRNRNGTTLCNRGSTKYICDSNLSDVSLTVLNVQEEESFTAEITSNCGMEKSQPIRVHLLYGGADPEPIAQEEESAHVTTILLCVVASVAAVVILYFLYRTYRRRGNGTTHTAVGSDDSV